MMVSLSQREINVSHPLLYLGSRPSLYGDTLQVPSGDSSTATTVALPGHFNPTPDDAAQAKCIFRRHAHMWFVKNLQ